MSEEIYYSNHARALKFPWSLYHRPLLEDLLNFFKENLKDDMNLLIIGPGDFFELGFLKEFKIKISLLDIDSRVLNRIKEKNPNLQISTYMVDELFNGYPIHEKFDVIYAKEVIEHIPRYDIFLEKIKGLLAENGKIWLSTPNYGYFILPFLERTILEFIARLSGFSRKDIHPSKFSAQSLKEAILKVGFRDVHISETDFRFAITAKGKR